jgi:tRNA(adenine34) deaminase
VVYGAHDLKAGACGSVLNVIDEPRLNHAPPVTSGVLAEEAGELLTSFFEMKRRQAAH